MKSQVIQIKTTPVASQLLPLRLSSPPLSTRRGFRFLLRSRRFPHPLEDLESAPGTLPPALLPAIR